MIKNVKLKNFLIRRIFVIFSFFNRLIQKKENKILLYSNMGFRDNIESLYQYLIENNYHQHYRIICSTPDWKKNRSSLKNVYFVNKWKGGFHYFTSSKVYYCFGRIPVKPAKNQISIQMWHGTSFKGFDQSTRQTNSLANQFYTWTFASSEFFRPIVSKKFSVTEETVFICGHPRTDIFYSKRIEQPDKKYIVWLPTFRKSSITGYTDSKLASNLPIFTDLNELEAILDLADIDLYIKLHPLQDPIELAQKKFKRIKIYDQQRFEAEKINLYEWLRNSAALMTDYSSVFYDYLLLDKPIGFTEDDMTSYGNTRGFAVEDPDWFRPGPRLNKPNDVYHFIDELSRGIDRFKERRREVNDLVNYYQDGENCKRALELTGIILK